MSEAALRIKGARATLLPYHADSATAVGRAVMALLGSEDRLTIEVLDAPPENGVVRYIVSSTYGGDVTVEAAAEAPAGAGETP